MPPALLYAFLNSCLLGGEVPNKKKVQELERRAREVRRDVITMLTRAGSGHTGGSLSCVEILVCLYFAKMKHRPEEPCWPSRDRFVLSKGHGCPTRYAILAMAGYFPREELWSLRRLGSMLQGHPCCTTTPGVESSSGSLGQGLSVANGMALAGKLDNSNYRVYCLLGDGEIDEGQVWEASMTASHYRLDNLCAILDHNGLQIDGPIEEVKNPLPLADKWVSFGWNTVEIDGHAIPQILEALDEVEAHEGQPSMIVAHTVKGKGVSFMENKAEYHGKAPTEEEMQRALQELQ